MCDMCSEISNTRTAKWSTYAIAFVITVAIFATALYASNYFQNRRMAEIRETQENISIDILSLETQFDLLTQRSCEDVTESTILPSELRTLAERLSYMESQRTTPRDDLLRLKRFYSLLQIKDILLMKEITAKCGLKAVTILYFYSNEENECKDCEKQGYVLTDLGEEYPQLRVYSFDYHMDVSALQTLISIHGVKPELPALVVQSKVHYGYKNQEEVLDILPKMEKLDSALAD